MFWIALPQLVENPVRFELPEISTAAEAAKAMGALVAAVASGELTPSEAEQVAKIVDAYVRALEANEFEARLQALEKETR